MTQEDKQQQYELLSFLGMMGEEPQNEEELERMELELKAVRKELARLKQNP